MSGSPTVNPIQTHHISTVEASGSPTLLSLSSSTMSVSVCHSSLLAWPGPSPVSCIISSCLWCYIWRKGHHLRQTTKDDHVSSQPGSSWTVAPSSQPLGSSSQLFPLSCSSWPASIPSTTRITFPSMQYLSCRSCSLNYPFSMECASSASTSTESMVCLYI